jgi:hypothetical protein
LVDAFAGCRVAHPGIFSVTSEDALASACEWSCIRSLDKLGYTKVPSRNEGRGQAAVAGRNFGLYACRILFDWGDIAPGAIDVGSYPYMPLEEKENAIVKKGAREAEAELAGRRKSNLNLSDRPRGHTGHVLEPGYHLIAPGSPD